MFFKTRLRKLQFFFRKSSFLMRLIATVMLCVCLPMFIIQYVTLSRSHEEMQSKNKEYYIHSTQYISNYIKQQMDGLRALALNISIDPLTRIPLQTSLPHSRYLSLVRCLKDCVQRNPLLEEMGIYYMQQDDIISSRYRYGTDTFCNVLADWEPALQQKLVDFFTTPLRDERCRVFSSMDDSLPGQGKLYISMPIPIMNYVEYDAQCFFVITCEDLANSIDSAFPVEGSRSVMVHHETNDILWSNVGKRNASLPAELASFLTKDGNAYTSMDEDGAMLHYYKAADEWFGLDFISIIPDTVVQGNYVVFYRNARTVFAISMICILCILAGTLYLNYRPLKSLVMALPKDDQAAADHSEIQTLSNAITHMNNRLSYQSDLLIDYLMNNLLYNAPIPRDKVRDMAAFNHVESFCVVSASCCLPQSPHLNRIVALIQQRVGCTVYVTTIPNKAYLLFICTSVGKIDRVQLQQSIALVLQQEGGISCKVCTGRVVSDLNELRASFLESQSNLSATTITCTDDHRRMISLLLTNLHNGYLEGALQNINDFFDQITQQTSFLMERYFCYELLKAFVDWARQTNAVDENQIETLLAFVSVDSLQKMLTELIVTICRQTSSEESRFLALSTQITNYLQDHFTEADISLSSVSERFGLSIYALSRLFKNNIGIGFKEWLTFKRLEYACQLIETTDCSIAEICAKSGFVTPANFTVLFKRHYQLTPTQFRNIKRGNAPTSKGFEA